MFKHLFRRYLSIALVLALVIVASFGSSGQAAAAGETGLERAIAAQEAHTDALMAIDGVIGTAVGPGNSGGHVVLVLTTAAGVSGIPNSVDGVTARPYVTGEINAQPKRGSGGPDRTARFDRPVPIGVSTGHPAITAGTIGARVIDASGNIFALSNNHVYADENQASINDAVIQPGTFDGGESPADDIGTLSNYVPIVFSTGANNVVDAAIAATDADTLGLGTPSDGYGVPSSTTVGAVVGLNVRKYGRTTGQTDGRVDGVNATVNIGYDSGTARFVNQVIIKGRKGSFSAGGDSGSLIVTKDGNNPVALLYAGNSTVTIGNPIDAVLTALNVSIDDGNGPAPTPNDMPVVSIDSVSDPANGTGYEIPESITFTGSANDTEDGILTGSISWSSSIDGTLGNNTASVTAALSAGTHTITASVTDSDGATGSDSISIEVVDPSAPIVTMTVASISFDEASRGKSTDLLFTIVIEDSNNNPVSGAAITSQLSRIGRAWDFNGVTDSSGSMSGTLRKARAGTEYTVQVNNVSHGSFSYVPGLTQNSCTVGADCAQ